MGTNKILDTIDLDNCLNTYPNETESNYPLQSSIEPDQH